MYKHSIFFCLFWCINILFYFASTKRKQKEKKSILFDFLFVCTSSCSSSMRIYYITFLAVKEELRLPGYQPGGSRCPPNRASRKGNFHLSRSSDYDLNFARQPASHFYLKLNPCNRCDIYNSLCGLNFQPVLLNSHKVIEHNQHVNRECLHAYLLNQKAIHFYFLS